MASEICALQREMSSLRVERNALQARVHALGGGGAPQASNAELEVAQARIRELELVIKVLVAQQHGSPTVSPLSSPRSPCGSAPQSPTLERAAWETEKPVQEELLAGLREQVKAMQQQEAAFAEREKALAEKEARLEQRERALLSRLGPLSPPTPRAEPMQLATGWKSFSMQTLQNSPAHEIRKPKTHLFGSDKKRKVPTLSSPVVFSSPSESLLTAMRNPATPESPGTKRSPSFQDIAGSASGTTDPVVSSSVSETSDYATRLRLIKQHAITALRQLSSRFEDVVKQLEKTCTGPDSVTAAQQYIDTVLGFRRILAAVPLPEGGETSERASALPLEHPNDKFQDFCRKLDRCVFEVRRKLASECDTMVKLASEQDDEQQLSPELRLCLTICKEIAKLPSLALAQ
eukprot:TRINITY_DN3059_c0_g1_i1.p1 TRINITY_DN3059_c0_g1~~TRINITY_DN3059_c0_g1_i1.p1  ORF type:complete len:445 (+),score=123.61 TRINITY_DN3059_c0_g1_i1:121-1335(+)